MLRKDQQQNLHVPSTWDAWNRLSLGNMKCLSHYFSDCVVDELKYYPTSSVSKPHLSIGEEDEWLAVSKRTLLVTSSSLFPLSCNFPITHFCSKNLKLNTPGAGHAFGHILRGKFRYLSQSSINNTIIAVCYAHIIY